MSKWRIDDSEIKNEYASFGRQFKVSGDYMDEDCLEDGFILNCSSDGNWSEFSYKKYTEDVLDYGCESEWDLFIKSTNYNNN